MLTVDAVTRSTRAMLDAFTEGRTDAAAILALMPWATIALTYVASAVLALISFFVVAAITYATASSFLGRPVTVGGSLRAAAAKFFR